MCADTSKPLAAPKQQEAVLFVSRPTIRPLLKDELKKVGVASPHMADDLSQCIELLVRTDDALLVIDWEHGLDTVNSALRAAQGAFKVDTRPIFLLTSELSKQVIATATEYNVTRVLSGEISRSSLSAELTAILGEKGLDGTLRSQLARVADARRRGDYNMSGLLLKDLNAVHPDDTRIICELADNLISEEKWDEAYAALEQLSVVDHENLRGQHLLARCLLKSSRFEEAVGILQHGQLINPFNVERLVDLGHALMGIDRLNEADEAFDAALALDDDNEDAIKGSGQCKLMQGDVNQALKLLRSVSGPREMASIFNTSAVLSIRHGRFEAGLDLYKTALRSCGELNRVQAQLLFNMGIAYHKWKDSEKALDCFQKAVQLDATFKKARHNAQILLQSSVSNAPQKLAYKEADDLPDDIVDDFEDEKVS